MKFSKHYPKFDANTTVAHLLHMLETWYGRKYDDFIILTLINLKYSSIKMSPLERENKK